LTSSLATEPATTTAAPSILQEVAKAVASLYNQFFDVAVSASDVIALVNALSFASGQMHVNPQIVGAFTQSLISQITSAVQNPNEEQKAKIIEGFKQSKNALDILIRWHPGLEQYDSDPKLLDDPELADLYQLVQSFQADVGRIVSDPDSAYDFLRDPKLPEILSRAWVTITNAGAVGLKYTTSKIFFDDL
jgi:hypothetical protein